MKVCLGADHRGFSLKGEIKKWLDEWGYEYEDFGAHVLDPNDDYTTFASRVAIEVSENENCLGVLSCGSGVGVDVTANKFDGVRASIGKSPDQIKAGRNDDNMNVLVIAADYTNRDEAKEMIKNFLESSYTPKQRYENRLHDIKVIEENN